MRRYRLGFVGAGNMAEAVCRAVVTHHVFSGDQMTAFDPAERRRRLFREEFQVESSADNATLGSQSEAIILACKPQQIPAVLAELRGSITADQLVISVAAGISTGFVQAGLSEAVPVVRVMPNTPLLLGFGASAICKGASTSDEHVALAVKVFGSAGLVLTMDERLMDAVTAVSGSGPAYFFYVIEAMVQAGTELGLSRADALKLAAQTCVGAGRMVLDGQAEPEELRRQVTSPGGTTEAALAVLEAEGVKRVLGQAIKAAAQRGRELGQ